MDEFYISLPEKSKDQSVSTLIRHAIAAIELDGRDEQDIEIEHFYLISPYGDGGRPVVYVKYAPVDQEDTQSRRDNLKLRQEFVDSDVLAPIGFAEEHRVGMRINRFEQRLPMHDEQGNAIRLLRETADALERLGKIEVKDLVLHSYLDDDGLDHPFVSVYYSS